MNNKEWLYSLDVADLSDWFDAEHADVERKCPGYEPENHRCRYHDTDFELTRENVCKLKREVAELQAENAKLWCINENIGAELANFGEQRDKVIAERDELTNAINELQRKQPYCYDPEAPLDTLRTVGRYIDELQTKLEDAEYERDRLREKLDDDWRYVSLKKQADMLRVKLADMIAERDEYREKFGGAIGAIEESGGWRDENRELAAERDYWKQQVQLCMDSAYPPSHSPERSYDPNVMGYPDRHGCTTPSTLVGAVIDGLRDERAAQYMALVKELTETKEERDELERENADLVRDIKEHKDYLDGWDMPSAMWVLRKYQNGELHRDCDVEMISLLDNEELKARVDELEAENAKLRAEVIQYAKDCGECGMAMPKGVSWPRFSDGSLVQFGDSIEVAGGVFAVERVEFTEHRYRLFTDKVGCFEDSPIGWIVEKPKRHERDEGMA